MLERDLLREVARHKGLMQRLALFEDMIVPTAGQTAEAARRAYGSPAGDFPEVIRTALAALQTDLDAKRLRFDLQRSRARLAFLLLEDDAQGEDAGAGAASGAPGSQQVREGSR